MFIVKLNKARSPDLNKFIHIQILIIFVELFHRFNPKSVNICSDKRDQRTKPPGDGHRRGSSGRRQVVRKQVDRRIGKTAAADRWR